MSSQQSNDTSATRSILSSQPFSLRAITPATSFSNSSSQEKPRDEGDSSNQPQRASEVARSNMKILVPRGSQPTSAAPMHFEPIGALKRTADGKIKSSTGSLATSPAETDIHMHSRTSSTTSQASKAADVRLDIHIVPLDLLTALQLKTRLSYASFKLQHGYEDMKFSDIEHLTSQHGSPVSASSYVPIETHRSPIKARKSLRSADSTPRVNKHVQMSPPQPLPFPQRSPKPPSRGSATITVPSSYEAFWSSQSSSQTRLQLPTKPSLAPPADIQARNPSRPTDSIRAPPPPSLLMPQQPSTPQRRRAGIGTLRSPSEQAASEAEAVEALAFMSSPNNSGYYHYHGLNDGPATPRKSVTSTPVRKPQSSRSAATAPGHPTAKQSVQNAIPARKGSSRPMTDEELDRRLDDMSDSEGEEDDPKAR